MENKLEVYSNLIHLKNVQDMHFLKTFSPLLLDSTYSSRY